MPLLSLLGRVARVLSLCVALLALARGARAADEPVPPQPARWATDTAGLLSPAVRDALDRKLEAYQGRTGHQLVVWVGQSIGSAALDDYAVRTFQAWKIGRAKHDDGILVLVLAKDRKIDIEVGYGLEDRVPDVTAKRIIDDVMVPALRAGDPDRAVTAGVDALIAAIEGRAPPPAEPGAQPSTGPPAQPSTLHTVLFGLLALGLLVLFVTHPSLAMYFLFSIFSGGGGFGGGRSGSGGGFSGGGGRSGGGGARGSW